MSVKLPQECRFFVLLFWYLEQDKAASWKQSSNSRNEYSSNAVYSILQEPSPRTSQWLWHGHCHVSIFQMGNRSTERHRPTIRGVKITVHVRYIGQSSLWASFRDKRSFFSAVWAAISLHCPVMTKNNVETSVPNSKSSNGGLSPRPRP